MPEPPADSHVRKKSRSPRYPSIPLDLAITRANALYAHEHKNWAPIAAVQEHWGFKPNTGPANGSVAAVKQFGLLETDGLGDRRRARLTALALEIILAEEPPRKFVREAALSPEIHRDLWERYNGILPSDATLRRELVIERNFTQSGAQEFVNQFRKTIAFARLGEADPEQTAPAPTPDASSPTDSQGAPQHQHHAPMPVQPTAGAGISLPKKGKTYTIPLLGDAEIEISGEFPITGAAWDQFLRVLEIYKPSLVVDSSDD